MVEVATNDSLNKSINSASKHYSSLFFLPSLKKTLFALAALCIIGVGLSTFLLLPATGLIVNLLFGISLLAANLFFDFIVSKVLGDPIFVLRRTVVLSLFCWIFWLGFIFLGDITGAIFGLQWWINLCIMGFSAVLTLRAVVFLSASSVSILRRIFAILFQPLPCIAVFVAFWANIDPATSFRVLPILLASSIMSFVSAFVFVSLIDRVGYRTHGLPAMSLFKAFMLNWVVNLNAPLEVFLEKLGEDSNIDVSLLKFDSSTKPKAAIIVPLVHPGPFKNIGSSLLPSLLKHGFEDTYGCKACVPLGILGHELDLASQVQNHKIISQVIASAKFDCSAHRAAPFVRVTDGFATASCQVFGDAAFLSFTLAPKTTEDLPQELGRIVREEAEKRGLSCAIVVNAHNSITETEEMDESLDALRDLAAKCLDKAHSMSAANFEVGAATVYPKEFGLKDGMGAGGITAIVVKVGKQKTAYIIIDGNNMVSGLREKILPALTSDGFDESEVFTTDTHAVSAVVTGRRGYHPVGENMDHEVLINHIKDVAKKAEADLESCKVGCLSMSIPEVRVIGQTRVESLSLLVDAALKRAKRVLIPVFAIEGLALLLLLALL